MATPAAASRADSGAPLVFDISSLGRRPGSMMSLHRAVPSPSRIGLELIGIEAGAELDLDLRFESVSEGVLVSGTVRAPTVGECSRCLEPISGDVEIALTELYAYPDSLTEATTEDGDVGRVVDLTVDLEPAIRDAVGLTLPFAPVCSPECPGLCTQCGVALATAEPGHRHEQIDPRWAKLAEIAAADNDAEGSPA